MIEILQAAGADFKANMWLYLSMPLISGAVGYVTNVIAIKMMFYPIEFLGIPPFIGWQGIVPRKAGKMAAISVDTITEHLITQQEMFDRLDPNRIADELEGPMLSLVDGIVDEVMREHLPGVWSNTPDAVKKQIKKRIQDDTPGVVADMMQETRDNIHRMFDLKEMVIAALVKDRDLLNRMFMEAGAPEFRFIGHSGAYFGFGFGLIQMSIWVFYKGAWLLPFCGLLVGYLTNWIALKMIFNPPQPKKYGPVTFQGLFHKRQPEVANDYANLVTTEVVTPQNILEAILKGPYSDKVFAMIQEHTQQAIDETMGMSKQLVTLTIGTEKYRAMKASAVQKVIAVAPDTLQNVTGYAEEAMDLRNTLSERLAALPPEDYEAMLRPAFQEDEWMLIAVGAVLGMMVGFFQLFVLFGQQVFGDEAEQLTALMLRVLGA